MMLPGLRLERVFKLYSTPKSKVVGNANIACGHIEVLDHRRGKRQQQLLLGVLATEFSYKSMSLNKVD